MRVIFDRFIGVEVRADKDYPFTYASIDSELNVRALGKGNIQDAYAFLAGQHNALAAVNSPLTTNKGLLKREAIRKRLSPKSQLGRWANLRLVEYELLERGVNVPKTPDSVDNSPRWMRLGFRLFAELRKLGYADHPHPEAARQCFECQGEAAFWQLLGHVPLTADTLEGCIQRQVVLKMTGLQVPDAMQFFTEITRHKLLLNKLPMEMVYSAGELNALAAAYTAFLCANEEEGTIKIGDEDEGVIVLPKETANQ